MHVSTLCTVCKGSLISDPQSGEIICSCCGLVSSDRAVETGAEWRNFGAETTSSRVGEPASLAKHDMGLATIIGRANKDANGGILRTDARSAIERLRTWDRRIQSRASSDGNLLHAFEELARLKGKLGLNDAMVEKTAYVYRKAQEKRLTRGRSISSILGACIYISCRELDAPITLRDIITICGIKRKDLTRNYRLLLIELDIKVPLIDTAKCIAKIANKADLGEKTKRQALSIMNDLARREIGAGKAPMGFAATILYMACKDGGVNATQKAIAEAAGVTGVTLRNRRRELSRALGKIE